MEFNLLYNIHKENPYDGFDYNSYHPELLEHKDVSSDFIKIMNKLRPESIVNVGAKMGESAISMSKYFKAEGQNCKIICIDTWLGSMEEKDCIDRTSDLSLKYGHPMLYYKFLANVMHNKLQDYIIPFPQTSLLAARFLMVSNYKADVIHIDSGNNENDAYEDINNYWHILREGGVIYGNNDAECYAGIREAASKFAHNNDIQVTFTDEIWFITKLPEDNQQAQTIHQKYRNTKMTVVVQERDWFFSKHTGYLLDLEFQHLSGVAAEMNSEIEALKHESAILNDKIKNKT